MLGRKNDVAHFAVGPAHGSVIVQFLDGDRLAVGVLVAFLLGFRFALCDEPRQIRGRLLRGKRGGKASEC